MIAPFLFLLSTLPAQERTAIKETLPNGAVIYLQKMEATKNFSLVVASVPKSEPETPETHGLRHLAEHIVARGAKRTLDRAVESKGLILLANTTRDGVTFQVTGPRRELREILLAVPELFSEFSVTEADVKKEIGIMAEEFALRSWETEVAADGWMRAYGERAIDPFGDMAALAKLTPADVNAAISRLLATDSLSVALVGDIDVEGDAKTIRNMVASLTKTPAESPWSRPEAPKPVKAGSADGESICVPIPPFGSQVSLASIGAALGIRAWIPSCRLLVTPSPRAGMVVLSMATGHNWVTTAQRYKGRETLIGQTGLIVLRSWLKESATDPARLAKLAAVMLPLNPSFDPQSLSKAADLVSPDEVSGAVRRIFLAAEGGQ